MRATPWRRLLAYEEGRRDAKNGSRQRETALPVIFDNRSMAELRRAIVSDIAALDHADLRRGATGVVCRSTQAPHRFVVTRTDDRLIIGRLVVELSVGTLICRYTFESLLPQCTQQTYVIAAGVDGPMFSIWREGLVTRFATTAALIRHMLGPLLELPCQPAVLGK